MYWYTSMLVAKFWFVSVYAIVPLYIPAYRDTIKNVESECAIH